MKELIAELKRVVAEYGDDIDLDREHVAYWLNRAIEALSATHTYNPETHVAVLKEPTQKMIFDVEVMKEKKA